MNTDNPSSDNPSSLTEDEKPQRTDVTNESSAEAPDPRPDLHGLKWVLTSTAVLSTTLLFSLDTTIVANVQPSIVQRFGQVEKLAWLGAAFALGSAATILPWSKTYGLFNIKALYISHVVIFETGSALCGGAPTMNALVVGRAIAGLGASGMYVGCLTYISVLTTVQERPIYMGLIGLVWGLGTVLGPVIGGAFINSDATWRWSFYINLVVGAIFSPIYIFWLPSVNLKPDLSVRHKLRTSVDWLGNILFAGATASFTMALTFGGTIFSWQSANEIALWIVTGVLYICFGLSQWLCPLVSKTHRLYPAGFMRRPTLLMLQIAIFMAATALLVPTYYIPLFFQFTRGSSALGSAVHLLPFVVLVVIFSLLNGSLMAKLGYYMPWYLLGGILVLVGSNLMYTVSSSTAASAVHGFTVLMGAGAGSFLQAGYGVTQALVSPEEIADAVGFMSLAQSLGIVVSLAIAGAVFENQAVSHLAKILPDYDRNVLRNSITGKRSDFLNSIPSAATQKDVINGIVKALSSVYLVVLVAGVIVTIIGILLPKEKLFVPETQKKTAGGNEEQS